MKQLTVEEAKKLWVFQEYRPFQAEVEFWQHDKMCGVILKDIIDHDYSYLMCNPETNSFEPLSLNYNELTEVRSALQKHLREMR